MAIDIPPIWLFTKGFCCSPNKTIGGIGYIIIYPKVSIDLINENIEEIKKQDPKMVENNMRDLIRVLIATLSREEKIEGSQGFLNTNDERIGLLSIIIGMRSIIDNIINKIIDPKISDSLLINTDSKFICDIIKQNWLEKWENNNWNTTDNILIKNKDLWEEIAILFKAFNIMHFFVHIDYVENESRYQEEINKCTEFAKESIEKKDLITDSNR